MPPPDVTEDAAAPAELVALPTLEVTEAPTDAADSEAELAAPDALAPIELAAADALDAADSPDSLAPDAAELAAPLA